MKKLIILLVTIVGLNYQLFSQTALVGMTVEGGQNFGTIFGISPGETSLKQQYSFQGAGGYMPEYTHWIEARGKLYGMTRQGGLFHQGVIIEYDYTTNICITKHSFNNNNNGEGSSPYGSLLLAANGKMYGMALGGFYLGVIFEYDYITNTYTKKIDLTTATGGQPYGSLIEASNGKLYGMTTQGGVNNSGTIFEYDYVSNTCTKKIDLATATGKIPYGSLVQASNGKLYGMTYAGGGNLNSMYRRGVIFEYDYITNIYTKKMDLTAADGCDPYGSLMQAANGKLYGMTNKGGANNYGVLFEYDYNTNIYSKKIEFNGSSNASWGTGALPYGSLIEPENGKLCGMTSGGNGEIFEYDYNNATFSKKYRFIIDAILFAPEDGKNPKGSLMKASNGKLYGMTNSGGTSWNSDHVYGTIFEYDYIADIYSKKIDLYNGKNGIYPFGSLVQASNGKLYGMSREGGSVTYYYGGGAIFEYDYESNNYTKKIDLIPATGSYPYGSLIQATNGKLYGMTYSGGVNNSGVIFEYDYLTNTYTKKIDFAVATGSGPFGSLIQATNGKLYGMTYYGGINNLGVIFEYDYLTNTYTKKIDLTTTNGCNPYGSLFQAANGKLYGMTNKGGSSNYGVIFEYDFSTNTYTKKLDFTGNNGANPRGSLIQASNGKMYGMTYAGGAFGSGVIFEVDYRNDTYSKKIDLSNSSGSFPMGSLMEASNGKLYGMTRSGGAGYDPWTDNSYGVIFEYDYNTNTYIKKFDFTGLTGSWPNYNNLIEIITHSILTDPLSPGSLCAGNPVSVPYTVTGTYNTGNIFTAQLSDETGHFIDPITIGTLENNTSGTISCTIPGDVPAGTGYMIRVISSDPAILGSDNGTDITVNTLPIITCPSNITVNSAPGRCLASVNFKAVASGIPSPTITYSHEPGSDFPVGITTVTANASNSCETVSCTFTVTVNYPESPVLTISYSDATNNFCNGILLTANSNVPVESYSWSNGITAQTNFLTTASASGNYIVNAVSTCGCPVIPSANFIYNKESLTSSYTLLATNSIKLQSNNTVLNGSVGVINSTGSASVKKNVSIAGPGAFLKAKNISLQAPYNIPMIIYAPADVTLPTIQYNSSNTNGLADASVTDGTTTTLNGNFKNVSIGKNCNVTLTGNIFGNISIKSKSNVLFVQSLIDVASVTMEEGQSNALTQLSFSSDAVMRCSGNIVVNRWSVLNPANNKVIIYIGKPGAAVDFTVAKGGNTTINASIFLPKGKITVAGDDINATYMNGKFIAENIESTGSNVFWNWHDCKDEPIPLVANKSALVSNMNKSDLIPNKFTVKAWPNPSNQQFILTVESISSEPVYIKVYDVLGRNVYLKTGTAIEQYQFGGRFISGMYMAEVRQGINRKTVKLVKQ